MKSVTASLKYILWTNFKNDNSWFQLAPACKYVIELKSLKLSVLSYVLRIKEIGDKIKLLGFYQMVLWFWRNILKLPTSKNVLSLQNHKLNHAPIIITTITIY